MNPLTLSLVLVFCHFGEPYDCKIVRLMPEATTPIGCLSEGAEREAAWLEEHPGWTGIRTVCEVNVVPQRPT